MMTSETPSTPPSLPEAAPRPRVPGPAWAMLAVAIVGFFDASYLAAEHFLNRYPPCSIVNGCETVTTSPYALLFGIPIAVLGALYYLGIIVALVLFVDRRWLWVLKWTARVTVLGFLFSLYLVYLQLFVLHAICSWCMLSALSSITLFVLGAVILAKRPAVKNPAGPRLV